MKLYGIPLCPFANRVYIGMKVRRIPDGDLPIETIDLANPPAAMLAINPFGSVPTVELSPGDGFNESLVILQWLDSLRAPGPRLYGTTPAEVARTQMRIEHVNAKFLSVLQGVLYAGGSKPVLDARMPLLKEAYSQLETQISKWTPAQGGPYFGGSELNAVDIDLAPFLVRLLAAKELNPAIPLPEPTSKAGSYLTAVTSHAAVKAVALPTDPALLQGMGKYLLPGESTRTIISASRALLTDAAKAVGELNAQLVGRTFHRLLPVAAGAPWSLRTGTKGPELYGSFVARDAGATIDVLTAIHGFQETADHHANVRLPDLKTLEISICTHEPKWGVTEKDIALARAISDKLTQ